MSTNCVLSSALAAAPPITRELLLPLAGSAPN
jgi:hypothetical protein